ncbi:hypothetical protein KDX20_29975 [Burkholderia cenocepacia]|uniref:hypothetical protein n=1 Tax=Burkholderia cenocepacia TaxID=95486 RepID=UPI001B9A3478|nr:hypothetical protein [Burkholderia cenocepacia]MBR8158656.1 hypothetical protein [Burkholderia cenocepacia]
MTAKQETNEYKCKQAAVRSLFQRIFDRSNLNQTQLEFCLGIEPANGSNYGRYLNGRTMSYGKFLQCVRAAWRQGFLVKDDLADLGFEDAAVTLEPADDIKKNRTKAATRFVEGQRRLLAGLLPLAVSSREGREIRAPRNEAEAASEYARWVSGIEMLGGRITEAKWAPAWYLSCLESMSCGDEGLSEHDLEQMFAAMEATQGESADIPLAKLPPYHPLHVSRLNLWFGGRDWAPYQHAIEESWTEPEVSADDLRELTERKERRDAARRLMLDVLARATSPGGRKTGGTTSNSQQQQRGTQQK